MQRLLQTRVSVRGAETPSVQKHSFHQLWPECYALFYFFTGCLYTNDILYQRTVNISSKNVLFVKLCVPANSVIFHISNTLLTARVRPTYFSFHKFYYQITLSFITQFSSLCLSKGVQRRNLCDFEFMCQTNHPGLAEKLFSFSIDRPWK